MERHASERKEGEFPTRSEEIPVTGVAYRELVGALLYVAICTRPDVMFAVMHLCKHYPHYQMEHYEAAIGVLLYLYGTRMRGLEYIPEKAGHNEMKLQVYTDSDHGKSDWKKRSTSGIAIMMGKNLIAWRSPLQR